MENKVDIAIGRQMIWEISISLLLGIILPILIALVILIFQLKSLATISYVVSHLSEFIIGGSAFMHLDLPYVFGIVILFSPFYLVLFAFPSFRKAQYKYTSRKRFLTISFLSYAAGLLVGSFIAFYVAGSIFTAIFWTCYGDSSVNHCAWLK